MPRRDKRDIRRTNNPYAPFSFIWGKMPVLFVPKAVRVRGGRPYSKIMSLDYGKSKSLTIRRNK